jgi:hypothetical protein
MKHRLLLPGIAASLDPDRAAGFQQLTLYIHGVRLIFPVPEIDAASVHNVRLLLEFEAEPNVKT